MSRKSSKNDSFARLANSCNNANGQTISTMKIKKSNRWNSRFFVLQRNVEEIEFVNDRFDSTVCIGPFSFFSIFLFSFFFFYFENGIDRGWSDVRLDRCHETYKNIVLASRVRATIARPSKTTVYPVLPLDWIVKKSSSRRTRADRRFSIYHFLYAIN